MRKMIKTILLIIVIAALLFVFHLNFKTHSVSANEEQNAKQEQPKTDNLNVENRSSCSDSVYVCERAALLVGHNFSASNYIWANRGQTIEFGGTSTGAFQLGMWVENKNGSFTSHIDIIPARTGDSLSFLAPFDGYYRVVIQNGSKSLSGSGYGYIQDTWPK